MKGAWVEAARCRECKDGWVPSHFGDEPDYAEQTAKRGTVVVSLCRACGAKHPWERRIIGRKIRPWWHLFLGAFVPNARWEWREPAPSVAKLPVMLTTRMRERLRALAFTDAQIDTMKPAEAWAVLREVDPEWYAAESAKETA